MNYHLFQKNSQSVFSKKIKSKWHHTLKRPCKLVLTSNVVWSSSGGIHMPARFFSFWTELDSCLSSGRFLLTAWDISWGVRQLRNLVFEWYFLESSAGHCILFYWISKGQIENMDKLPLRKYFDKIRFVFFTSFIFCLSLLLLDYYYGCQWSWHYLFNFST